MMKKSEIFKKACYAVIESSSIFIKEKLEILEALLWEESIQKTLEESREKESEAQTNGEL